MRLFFALWPSVEEQILFRNAAQGPGPRFSARWIALENIHLTLLFLPSVTEEQIGPLFSLVERSLLPAIRLRLDRLIFQSSGKEGLLWLAPAESLTALTNLVGLLQERLAPLGISARQRRPFSPHITLARRVVLSRAGGGCSLPLVLRSLEKPIDWPVREMALVSSETLPEGSRYTPLASWALPASA
ncbi:MAG: RNA 2',3'-cyclic phosphodiesterase [Candidatus Methylacidiphilaceae bacterium]